MKPTYRALAWCLIPVMLLQGTGCTRRFFRKSADRDVADLLKEKGGDPRWSLDGYFVYPNPEARFGDTTNPDRPPMPPDDPGACELSPNPQKPYKQSGVGHVEGTGYLDKLNEWDVRNRAEEAERERAERERLAAEEKKEVEKLPPPTPNGVGNGPKPKQPPVEGMSKPPDDAIGTPSGTPGQMSYDQILAQSEERARRELAEAVTVKGPIPEKEAEKKISKERTFLIKLDQAIELGLINSREYQTRREQVYLAALPVTLERFAFVPQLFALETGFRERFGRQTPEGLTNRWRLERQAGLTQTFSTGALLLLSFANRTVFNLFNKPDTSVSVLSLDLVQPLLQGAGKAVVLEPLTQAERNLLYIIRDFAKFKQDFYVYLAAGQPNIVGVQIDLTRLLVGSTSPPGAFSPNATPLVRPIVPGLVGPQVVPGDGVRLNPVNQPTAPSQGYLSTLIEKAQLVNQYRNIEALKGFLTLFRVYLEGGIVNSVQVGQVEQQLLSSVTRGLTQQAQYRGSVDQFKLQLGLPMWLRLEVEDGPLDPMFEQTRRYETISSQYLQVSTQGQQYSRPGEENLLRGRLRNLLVSGAFVRGTRMGERVGPLLDEWAKMPKADGMKDPLQEKLDTLTKERNALREKREQLKDKEKGDLPEKEARRLEALELQIEVGNYERALRAYESRFWSTEKDPGQRLALQNRTYNTVYRYFLSIIEEAFSDRQERVRRLWPDLPPVCVDGVDLLSADDDTVLAATTRAALESRLDLMNARAQLVDSWRKIRVAANSLLATFNVQYHADWSSPAGFFRPFEIGGSRTRHQLVVDTELPLVRIAQRNAYRATLIAYQQQRRQLMQAEDQVLFDVRTQLRQLRAGAYNYHNVQKRAIELAYRQVDQSLQAFSQPQQPSGPSAPPGSVGAPVGGGGGGGGGGDPAALTQQLLGAQNSLLNAQNDLYNTWIGYIINRISIYRDMGLMQLDPRGVWIDDVATCHCPPAPSATPNRSEPTPKLPLSDERTTYERLPAPRPATPAEK